MSRLQSGIRRAILCGALGISTIAFLLIVQNVALSAFFPHLERFPTDVSSAYLKRELALLSQQLPQTIFLGDSVLWGYRLAPEQTAVAILSERGCACRNFAFKSGSPPNYYAFVKLLVASRVRPRAMVIEINQKAFNPLDDSYRNLYPPLAELAQPLLPQVERDHLKVPGVGPEAQLEHWVSSWWLLYAMRSDIRETIAGEAPTPPTRITAQLFEGSYNLQKLTKRNIGVHFLRQTVRTLRDARIPTLAFLTPTNHALLHEYIDGTEYDNNRLYLKKTLEAQGVRVLDLDRQFSAKEFFDNAHLTAEGQRRLADLLEAALPHSGLVMRAPG